MAKSKTDLRPKVWSGKLKCTFHGPRHWELDKELSFLSVNANRHIDRWKQLGVNISVPKNQGFGTKAKIKVEQGYHTDLASIHRAAWSFIAPWDVARAAVIHDVLYEALRENKVKLTPAKIKEMRKAADNVMLEGMMAAQPTVSNLKVKVVYGVLRMTGGMALKHSSYRERHGW